jgi:hypothetical protein
MQLLTSSRGGRLTQFLTDWVVILALLLMAAQAASASLRAADEKAVRSVIQAQLSAFATDDANKAFSYAAPNIQQMFGKANNFLAMVREQYPVVYRPASVTFLKPETMKLYGKNTEVVQQVQMTDTDAGRWTATYSLAQQKNKAWRITGCVVVANTAVTV